MPLDLCGFSARSAESGTQHAAAAGRIGARRDHTAESPAVQASARAGHTARRARHSGLLLWLAGQDFLNVPSELLGLATQVLVFRLNNPEVFL
ncbi:MAG TPA: hypothetical protein PKK15_16625, partial [Kouleothrix sp.]|nr:hypothetical protein [Kouleothrix sp.]